MGSSKKNGKIKIQDEREKRQSQLVAVQQEKVATQNRLSQLNIMELKLAGALEQLDELEGIKPPAPSDNGAPEKEKVSEKKES